LVQILCLIKAEKQEPDCAKVKSCETVTSLSPFEVDGTIVSITYKDENGISITRSFDAATVVNNTLNDINPNCLTSEVTWESLTFEERIQLLIDSHCDCCAD